MWLATASNISLFISSFFLFSYFICDFQDRTQMEDVSGRRKLLFFFFSWGWGRWRAAPPADGPPPRQPPISPLSRCSGQEPALSVCIHGSLTCQLTSLLFLWIFSLSWQMAFSLLEITIWLHLFSSKTTGSATALRLHTNGIICHSRLLEELRQLSLRHILLANFPGSKPK